MNEIMERNSAGKRGCPFDLASGLSDMLRYVHQKSVHLKGGYG